MATQDFLLNEAWTVVFTGPTNTSLFIETTGKPILFRIGTSEPALNSGHRLDNDTHGQAVTLDAGEFLYARSIENEASIVLTGA